MLEKDNKDKFEIGVDFVGSHSVYYLENPEEFWKTICEEMRYARNRKSTAKSITLKSKEPIND